MVFKHTSKKNRRLAVDEKKLPPELKNYLVTNNETKIIQNLEFSVSSDCLIENKNFEYCTFILRDIKRIHFKDCVLYHCKMGTINPLFPAEYVSNLTLTKCRNTYSSFKGVYNSIIIEDCQVKGISDETSTNIYSVENSEIIASSLLGDCNSLSFNNSIFKAKSFLPYNENDAVWDKKIHIDARCRRATFENIKLNPFYLATKCNDKTSLDLTRATLIDDWSRLRKKYAGINLIIVFLLTLIFFLPLLTKSFILLLAAKIDPALANFEHIKLWKALLFDGKEEIFSRISYIFLTAVLLVYNVGRMGLTISIAKLKEEEQFLNDSNFNLVSIHPEKLKTQIKVDKILNIMLWISIGYSVIKLWNTLMIEVPIF